ncbi:MAG: EAL domain-containing protein [Pseudomonadota bacterium]
MRGFLTFVSRHTILVATGYVFVSLIGFSAVVQPEQAGVLTALALTGLALILAYDGVQRRRSETAVLQRLETLQEQHALLSADVSRWHRQAVQGARAQDTLADPAPATIAPPAAPTSHLRLATSDGTPADVSVFDDVMVGILLHDALNEARMNVVIQPIMRLPQRRPAMLEVFARLPSKTGHPAVPAQRFIPGLRQSHKVALIDRLALQYAFDLILDPARSGHTLPYMINIGSETLKDGAFMTRLLHVLKQQNRLAHRLIFEMRQVDFQALPAPLLAIMDGMAALGCRFSMDNVDMPQFTRSFLRKHHISFVKLSGARLSHMARTASGVETVRRIRANLARDGVTLIAERIEHNPVLMDVLDLGLDYGQGYYLAQPAAPQTSSKRQAA